MAPHPDDEVLGTAGVILAAVKAGAQVKIVYLTHGESNEISALFYRKKPMLLKSDFVKAGRVRKQEAREAMAVLGVPEKDLIFFGYPDMGTMPVWEKFWVSVKPFRSYFARTNKVTQDDDFSFGKPYRGFNIVHDFEKVILETKPTHIFVTAPFDLNLDHQAAYLFLNTALLNLKGSPEIDPAVHLYVVHEHDWPQPRNYSPAAPLEFPFVPAQPDVRWARYSLSPAEVRKKEESLLNFDSQLSYSKNFLLSFVRANEIYAEYSYESLPIEQEPAHDAWPAPSSGTAKKIIYVADEKELFIEIPMIRGLDEMGALSTDIFGYKNGRPFIEMPKLKLRLLGNKLLAKDGTRNFRDSHILFKIEKDRLFIRVPWKSLRDPDVLFVATRTAKNRLALDFGSWRVLRLGKNKNSLTSSPEVS